MRFAVKHTVAGCLLVGTAITTTAASYFALLAWAILVGQPLGGLLAFPFMMLAALVASVLSVGLILLPATAVAEWIAVKKQLRMLVQILIAVGLTGVFLLIAMLGLALMGEMSWGSAAASAGVMFAMLSLPLALYWWSVQSADWLLRGATGWFDSRLRTNDIPHPEPPN
jgi:hypothetical protein